MILKQSKYFLLFVLITMISCKWESKKQYLINNNQKNNPSSYDSTINKFDNLFKGFIDTFTVNNTLYKVEMDTSQQEINFFYKKNNIWIKNINDIFERGYNTNYDYNLDGFKDLTNVFRRENNIYLWNPKENKLVDSAFVLSWDCKLIDSTNLIYYSHYNFYGKEGGCELFQIKNYKTYSLYNLEGEANEDYSEFKWILTKGPNGEFDEKNIIKKFNSTIGHLELDYELFWNIFLKENNIVLKQRKN